MPGKTSNQSLESAGADQTNNRVEAVAPHKHSHHRSTNHSPIFWVPRFIDVPYLVPILILFLVKKMCPVLSCFFLSQIKAVAHVQNGMKFITQTGSFPTYPILSYPILSIHPSIHPSSNTWHLSSWTLWVDLSVLVPVGWLAGWYISFTGWWFSGGTVINMYIYRCVYIYIYIHTWNPFMTLVVVGSLALFWEVDLQK